MSTSLDTHIAINNDALRLPYECNLNNLNAEVRDFYENNFLRQDVNVSRFNQPVYLEDYEIDHCYALLTHVYKIQYRYVRYIPSNMTWHISLHNDTYTIDLVKNLITDHDVYIVIMPVFVNGNHWVLFVYDKLCDSITYFDSFKHSRNDLCNSIKHMLSLVGVDTTNSTLHTEMSGPLQRDGHSCGIYTISFIEKLFNSLILHISPNYSFDDSDMMSIRSRYFRALYHNPNIIRDEPLPNVHISNHIVDLDSVSGESDVSVTKNFTSTPTKHKSNQVYVNNERKVLDSVKFNGNLEEFNCDIHQYIDQKLNMDKICKMCSKGFLSIKFNGDICNSCSRYMLYNKTNISNFSAQNDMDPGELPSILEDLTLAEKCVIRLISPSLIVAHLKYGELMNSGHTIFFPNNINDVVSKLPRTKTNIVVFGRIRSDGKINCLKVRRNRVKECLLFLIQNNPYYQNISIDEDAFKKLPDNDFIEPDEFIRDDSSEEVVDDSIFAENPESDSALVGTSVKLADKSIIEHKLRKMKLIELAPTSLDPINEFREPGLMTKAFPYLFPYGNCELFNKTRRPHGIFSIKDYFRHLISLKYSRFREDLEFKFVATNITMRNEVFQATRLTLRHNAQIKNMSTEELREELKDPNSQVKSSLNLFKKEITGSPFFWMQERNKLEEAVRQLGHPAYFCTLSLGDHHWKALRKLYNVSSKKEIKKAVAKDPFITTIYFYEKVKAFLEIFLPQYLNVSHYHGRFEVQSRGALHFHCILWVDKFSDIMSKKPINLDDLVNFTDEHVSAENPYVDQVDSSPTVDDLCSLEPHEINDVITHGGKLLNACMRHTKCSKKYCLKTIDNTLKCRYGFPKVLRKKTTIEFPAPNKYLSVGLKCNDQFVCSHNKALTGCFNSNCDFQIIASKQKIFGYLLKYTTKPEKISDKAARIQKVLDDSSITSKKTLLNKIFMQDGRRDVSAQEAAMYLLKLPMVLSSHSFIYVNTTGSRSVTENGTVDSSITKYIKRAAEYEDYSMFEYFKTVNIYCNGKTSKRKDPDNTIIAPIPYVAPETERYYERECILHFPFRKLSDLQPINGSWEEKWLSLPKKVYKCEYNFSEIDINHFDLYELVNFQNSNNPPEFSKTIEDYLDLIQQDTIKYEDLLNVDKFIHYPNYDYNLEAQSYSLDDLKQIIKEIKKAEIKQNYPYINPNTLNRQQRIIYNKVYEHFLDPREQLLLQVQGVSGAGKSYLIKAMQYFMKEKQITMSYTGTSASLLSGGYTIHSALSLSISGVKSLSTEAQERLRKKFSCIKYLIIDEFSMVSLELLEQIDSQLKLIFPEKSQYVFSNFNIILLGDLFQLGTIKSSPLYKRDISIHKTNALKGKFLYNCFTTKALLTNSVRQQNDSWFFGILNRVKTGDSTIEDYRELMKYLYDHNDSTFNNEAIRLFYDNNSCKKHNYETLRQMQSADNPICIMTASGKYKNVKRSKNPNAGFVKQKVVLCKECIVMLTKNISIPLKLTNGAFFKVKKILYFEGEPPAIPQYVLVQPLFDYKGPTTHDGLIPIKSVSCEGETLNIRYMKNIPLQLAFAVTYFKCQGATLPKVIINLGDEENALGSTYVSLSRVRNIADLRLFPFPFSRLTSIKSHKDLKDRTEDYQIIVNKNIAK